MQLPVVTTDADGLPENVEDGTSGFIVPRRDPSALAGKLALLARSPELRHQMGLAGRTRVLEHFNQGQQMDAFEEFYNQLLNQP